MLSNHLLVLYDRSIQKERKVAILRSGSIRTDLLIKIQGLAAKAENSIADYKRRLGVANTFVAIEHGATGVTDATCSLYGMPSRI